MADRGRQLYRLSTTWVSDAGRIRIPQPPSYLYLTSNPIRQQQAGPDDVRAAAVRGPGQGMRLDTRCGPPNRLSAPPSSPASGAGRGPPACTAEVPGKTSPRSIPGFAVYWTFPMLIAAVDPAAEARLDGLNRAVTSGRYLGEQAGPAVTSGTGGIAYTTFPVLAAARGGVGEYAVTQVQRLPRPATAPRLDPAALRRDATAARSACDRGPGQRGPGLPAVAGRDRRHRAPGLQPDPERLLECGPDPLPPGWRGPPGGLAGNQPGLGLVHGAARRAWAGDGQRRDCLPGRERARDDQPQPGGQPGSGPGAASSRRVRPGPDL